jgi:predicted Rossmann fold flavoprotein
VTTSKHYDVVVLGAGAAGLMCAFTAAQRGRQVLLLEKSNKIGKKILMSGGGRCNFTNQIVEADNFISNNPHFCKSALNRYTQWDFIAMVEQHGIEYEERKHGQLFCVNSAKDILAMLLERCESAGVEIRSHCEVRKIEVAESNTEQRSYPFNILCESSSDSTSAAVNCESLVIATGALSIPTLGGSGAGYDVARQFGLPLTERRAGLVPFMFSDGLKPLCERLSGLATEVEVSCNGQSFSENMLFTHRGISGPAILQISNYWFPGDEVSINLLPNCNIAEWLLEQKKDRGKLRLKNLLGQDLPRALVDELQSLWWSDLADTPLADFSDKKLAAIAKKLTNWRLKPSATEGYRTAEVTLGGVDTQSISSKTMEAKQQAGLYFIGEVLDVTGHLGGFNFQWAWSSGYSAGLYA